MERGSWYARRPGPAVSTVLIMLAASAMAAPAGVTLSDPWIRYIGPQTPAAGYFTLTNSGGQPALLDGASSPGCAQLMLHRSVATNGMASMQMVPSVAVPAHGSLTFGPGGYHLMCMQPAAAMKVGASVPVTLRFHDGTSLTQSFPVRGAKGQ